jgi:hypothetical protein
MELKQILGHMSGYSGISGQSGVSGATVSGYSGISGQAAGESGVSGYSGTSGVSGATVSGYSGVSGATGTFSRGGTIINASGVSTGNFVVWRAPYACTVTNVRGWRTGGSAATINARKNGTSNHLASNLSLASTDTWLDGGAVQNQSYAAGDDLQIMIVSATGATQIAIQVDFTKP